MPTFFFFLFSSIMFGASVLVIRSTNAVHSVFFLILVFVNATALLLLVQVEFLAIMLVIIYVGAIAILFLFVVMMLDISVRPVRTHEIFHFLPLLGVLGASFLVETYAVLKGTFPLRSALYGNAAVLVERTESVVKELIPYDELQSHLHVDLLLNLDTLGQVLYSYYGVLFLIAGIVLLIALLGSVILTLQEKQQPTVQQLFRQLSRDAQYASVSFSSSFVR